MSARQSAAPRVGAEQAQRAVRRLEEMAADVRGCAVLADGGEVLAASDDGARQDGWRAGAADLLAAADAARDEQAVHVHVATEDGEVLAVRHGGFAIVAVAERFTLASLLVFDIRTVLRDLVAGTA